jgi:hypothetical protein
VTSQTDDIYDVKEPPPSERATLLAPAPIIEPARPRDRTGLRWIAQALTWLIVGIFLLWGGVWAYQAGMNVRREIWQSTRSIRFKTDVARGFNYGNQVLRYCETQVGLDPMADALADQSPKVLQKAGRPELAGTSSVTLRRLTPAELLHGMVHFVDSVVDEHQDDQNYDLDYPPLRLAIMTLWVRHVQRLHPDMESFPGDRTDDTSMGQDEDVAEPMLKFNAYCAAAAAVLMFLLVWLWVNRGALPPKPSRIMRWWRKRRGLPAKVNPVLISPLRSGWIVPHGMFAFMLATAGFWYAYVTLVHIPPRPAPVVSVTGVQPTGDHATISATINAQGVDTQWHVDYGPTLTYGHSTPAQTIDTSLDDQTLSAGISGLKPGETIHFRVSAASAGGTTSSDDLFFVNAGPAINIDGASVGGIDWPTWTVWLRLLALFIIMVASARVLPTAHRAWACGAVAAMLVWLDPLTLIDSHAWPQWDIWILPVFLAATLLASLDWWMAAGILLSVGCMAKGQLLLAGPILMLWPLLEGRWGALVRILCGFAIGAELIAWPWIVSSPQELGWIVTAMVGAALILAASFMRPALRTSLRDGILAPLFARRGEAEILAPEQALPTLLLLASLAIAALAITTALIFHGLHGRQSLLPGGTMGWFLILVLLPPWFLRRRSLGIWLACVFAMTVWIASLSFGGSYSWLTLGFAYGSVKHDQMQMSIRNFSNLTSLLSDSYHWDIHDLFGTLRFSFTTPGPWRLGRLISIPAVKWSWSSDLDVKTSMAILYGICLLIASAAAAIHSRRNDVRFLVALVVPWIVFPMVMCQMGDRYPVWACGVSAAMVAVSMELTLLHVVLAVFAFSMVAHHLVTFDAQRWAQLFQLTTPMYPDVAWMLVLIAAIFLVAALVPSRKRMGTSARMESDSTAEG